MLLVIGFLGDGKGLDNAACSEASFGLTEMPERVTSGGSLSARKLGNAEQFVMPLRGGGRNFTMGSESA